MSEAEKAQGGTEQHDKVDVSGCKQPDLTTEEQDFVKMLCRVLPKLVSGLEMPTDRKAAKGLINSIERFKEVGKRIRAVEGDAQLMDALVELREAAGVYPTYRTLPGFLKAQEKVQSIDYNNILTAATFFSAVTATTLQLSYAYNTSPHASFGVAVNTLWFVALVFSTASSLNSLVGLTWYQKIRRDQLLPDWAKLWVEYGPAISLAVASAAFSAGLCLFAFSSSQHTITSVLTTAFTAAHAVALFAPLCLYSPNRISRFLLEVFTPPFSYSKKVCLRWWYLRRVPRQDRDRVTNLMTYRDWSKANVARAQRIVKERRARNRVPAREPQTGPTAATSPTGDASPDSSSSLIGVVKINIGMAWTSACSYTHSVVAWLSTCWLDWLALRRRRTRVTKDSSKMEQAHKADEKVAAQSKIERDIESQGDAGNSGKPKPTMTEGQDITLSQRARISTSDVTYPDEGAALAAEELGVEVEHGLNTRPSLELAQGHTAATWSTAHPIPCSSSSPIVQNSDNGLEDGAKQETNTSGRPNTSQEGEPGPPFDPSAQGGIEAHSIDASNPTFKVERRRKVAFEEDRPSADVGSPENLK
ncbi:hypothetical protein M0805_002394 [Coniferiporia weirii]|nr:hypothetical protein M0805_002394 [Coniferiporia weirii]